MPQEQALAFYERRAREERDRAESAREDCVVLVHLAMAFAYEALLGHPGGAAQSTTFLPRRDWLSPGGCPLSTTGHSVERDEPRSPSRVQPRMAHASNIIHCDGPDSPHAFDIIPLQPRNGSLDARCPVCRGHGQWNVEIDLVSFRCKRAICGRCHGAGWVETGSDPVGVPDIEMTPEGYPKWVIVYPSPEEVEASRVEPGLIPPA